MVVSLLLSLCLLASHSRRKCYEQSYYVYLLSGVNQAKRDRLTFMAKVPVHP